MLTHGISKGIKSPTDLRGWKQSHSDCQIWKPCFRIGVWCLCISSHAAYLVYQSSTYVCMAYHLMRTVSQLKSEHFYLLYCTDCTYEAGLYEANKSLMSCREGQTDLYWVISITTSKVLIPVCFSQDICVYGVCVLKTYACTPLLYPCRGHIIVFSMTWRCERTTHWERLPDKTRHHGMLNVVADLSSPHLFFVAYPPETEFFIPVIHSKTWKCEPRSLMSRSDFGICMRTSLSARNFTRCAVNRKRLCMTWSMGDVCCVCTCVYVFVCLVTCILLRADWGIKNKIIWVKDNSHDVWGVSNDCSDLVGG